MKKSAFRQFPVGSPEYVIFHAKWRKSRGKKGPSVSFLGCKNPNQALELAKMRYYCHDCGAKPGDFHQAGCDMEECPFCHQQLITCNCCYEQLGIDSSQEPTYSNGLNEEQAKKWNELLRVKGLVPYGQETRFSDLRPRATVCMVNGQVILDDPEALAIMRVVSKHNCQNTFEMNKDRIEHFRNRMIETEKFPKDVVIVVINVDDVFGCLLANVLMPDFNWQEIRDRGEIPIARGLASRDYIQFFLNIIDSDAAKKLLEINEVAVVVVDYGVAEIFSIN